MTSQTSRKAFFCRLIDCADSSREELTREDTKRPEGGPVAALKSTKTSGLARTNLASNAELIIILFNFIFLTAGKTVLVKVILSLGKAYTSPRYSEESAGLDEVVA